jgi:hypothetical protein
MKIYQLIKAEEQQLNQLKTRAVVRMMRKTNGSVIVTWLMLRRMI